MLEESGGHLLLFFICQSLSLDTLSPVKWSCQEGLVPSLNHLSSLLIVNEVFNTIFKPCDDVIVILCL